MMRTTRRTTALASAVLFSIAVIACNKKNDSATDTTSLGTTMTAGVDTTPIRVSDIQVGKAIGSDKKVSDQTTSFGVRDTMYVAVITDGAAKDAKLTAKWTFNGTQIVKESSQTISPAGGTNATEFHITKPSAWPKGKYKVDVALNGAPAGTKDFEVK